jgi:uncharacterized membrane protein YcaP (DUF421 family)
MENKEEPSIFDWTRLIIGEDLPYLFLLEVVFRTFIMFMIVLFVLRMIGKRGIKQLSVFELALIISLGSAAGDPMFYYDVGLLPATVVFIVIILLYKGITYLSEKNEKIEKFVEGEPVKLIENGRIKLQNFDSESIAQDEFYAQLRMKNIDHLGQVKKAFIETSGEMSVFYFPDDQVEWGLPILPDENECVMEIPDNIQPSINYVCGFCGTLADEFAKSSQKCGHCGKSKWTIAKNNPRVM